MINLDRIPSPEHKLVFGEQDIGRLDLPFDSKFKSLAEVDEANVWFLNVVLPVVIGSYYVMRFKLNTSK